MNRDFIRIVLSILSKAAITIAFCGAVGVAYMNTFGNGSKMPLIPSMILLAGGVLSGDAIVDKILRK